MKKYDWLNKKTPRSVDLLRLWQENPRLNPEEKHIHITDFAEEMTAEEADRKDFFKLLKSIAEDGFIPADPIIVWKNEENNKYYVAEGNRRVLALKLLREPNKAPKSIRGFVRTQSQRINKKDIEKVLVNVAPAFEEAEWYINQRNSTSSLQKPWSRIQQQRWLSELYDKYSGDIDKITSITKMTQSELEGFIRILKIRDFVKLDEVKNYLTDEEFAAAVSYKFPISILERFFSNSKVREQWGIDYTGTDIELINKSDFLNAYRELIKNVVGKYPQVIIDTRTITTSLDNILEQLPKVDLQNVDSGEQLKEEEPVTSPDEERPGLEASTPEPVQDRPIVKNNPNRSRLVLEIYTINTDSYRIAELFYELQTIPPRYRNCIASSMRVFLDLCVLKYIESENLVEEIQRKFNVKFKDLSLKYRLEYLKTNCLTGKPKKIVEKLLQHTNEYSLDVLNGYVHGQDSHYLGKSFLNGFWDFMFPLLQQLVEINEERQSQILH